MASNAGWKVPNSIFNSGGQGCCIISANTFSNLTVGANGYLTGVSGDKFQIGGNFTNNSTQSSLWSTAAAELDFIAPGTAGAHTFLLAGKDLGQTPAGMNNNFAWGILSLGTGQSLSLSGTIGTNALYVGQILGLTLSGLNVTDITGNGLNIYYDPTQDPGLNDLTYNLGNGGFLEPDSPAPVPIPPGVLLLGSGLLGMGLLGWRRKTSA